ncbi:MAG: ATP synthase F1 subunit delta [bacterium]|nr:ATP synthase F1 subunit delta [bacterium]
MSEAIKDKNSELVSKRWAKALIELVQEDENISKREVLENLKEISETFESSEELSSVINNPSVSVEEKQVVLCKLFQDKVLPIVYNFLFALNLKKRAGLIPAITEAFSKELDEIENISRVNIVSAIELSDERKEEIKTRVAEKLKKEVIVDWDVDNDIIAGLIFKVDELTIDNSVRQKLDDLSKNLMKI